VFVWFVKPDLADPLDEATDTVGLGGQLRLAGNGQRGLNPGV
jgi:hypothetical protein